MPGLGANIPLAKAVVNRSWNSLRGISFGFKSQP